MKIRVFFFSLLLFSSTPCTSQCDFLALRQTMQHTLDSIVQADGLPGATLAAVLPDGRPISLAAGYEDVELKKPMPVGGTMFTGSTGKMFVSAVALQLVAEGKFGLDDKVSGFFQHDKDAWFHRLPNAADLTVRSLMNHTSGLPEYIFTEGFLAAIKADLMRAWTPQECLAFILGMNPRHPVGKGWGYSDTNYILLGLIIEKMTGSTFYEQAQQRLLAPLHLRHTQPSTQRSLPGLVQAYIGDNNFFELPKKTLTVEGLYCMNPQFEWCGGGFVTNVEDLAFWLRWLHTGKVLAPAQYAQLIEPVDFKTGQSAAAGYGLGSFVWQTEEGRFFGHAGIMPGYLTQAEFSEKHGFSIAFQTNTDQGMGRKYHAHVQRFAGQIAGCLDAQKSADEQRILAMLQRQTELWNEGKLEEFMRIGYVRSDSIRMISRSKITYGYDPILQNYLKNYPPDKMGKLAFDQLSFTRLSDEYYYVVGRYNLTYSDKPEPVRGFFSILMRKVGGEWLTVSDHSG